MLQIQYLIFDYPGCRALNNISFTLERGTVTALVGPNGAGKTTLMRCIAGLEPPLDGRIVVDGINVADFPRKAHRKIGYLSDTFGLYEKLTVYQCLSYAAATRGIPPNRQEQAIELAASRLGLAHCLKNTSDSLSRGWRQRLGIAQAIIHEPEILILDEPASGLDPEARRDLSTLFRQLHQTGMTLLVSSHILSELNEYSTHMLALRKGRLLEFCALGQKNERSKQRLLSAILAAPDNAFPQWLGVQPHITLISTEAATTHFSFTGNDQEQVDLLSAITQQGFPIISFSEIKESLQQTYLTSATQQTNVTENHHEP